MAAAGNIGSFIASEGSCRTRRGWAAPNAAASGASGGRILPRHLPMIPWFPLISSSMGHHGAFWSFWSCWLYMTVPFCFPCTVRSAPFFTISWDLYFKLWDALSSCCANLQWDVAARVGVLWWSDIIWPRFGSGMPACLSGAVADIWVEDSWPMTQQFSMFSEARAVRSITCHSWPAAAWPSSFKNRASKRCTARCSARNPNHTLTQGPWARFDPGTDWQSCFASYFQGISGVCPSFIMHAHCQFQKHLEPGGISSCRWGSWAPTSRGAKPNQPAHHCHIWLPEGTDHSWNKSSAKHLGASVSSTARVQVTSSMSAQLLFRNIPSARCCAVSCTWHILDMFQELKPVGTAGP